MEGNYSNCEVNMQSNHKDTHSDSLSTRLAHEAKAIAIAALYFGCWLAVLVIIKKLRLADYEIAYEGLS